MNIKNSLFLSALSVVALTSCVSENEDLNKIGKEVGAMELNVDIVQPETRSVTEVDDFPVVIYDAEGKSIVGNAEYDITDRFLENASFLRCDNITLGYSFSKNRVSGRAYCTVSNPFVITKYSGLDPEIGIGGVDNSIYPRSMTTVLGINLQF